MTLRHKSITIQERTVYTLFFTLCLLALVYCVVLLSLVFSVIERKQNTIAQREVHSELTTLELEYANKVASIRDTTLKEHNFTRIDNTTFAVRKAPIASYTVLYAQ